jgi:hypothetical protein
MDRVAGPLGVLAEVLPLPPLVAEPMEVQAVAQVADPVVAARVVAARVVVVPAVVVARVAVAQAVVAQAVVDPAVVDPAVVDPAVVVPAVVVPVVVVPVVVVPAVVVPAVADPVVVATAVDLCAPSVFKRFLDGERKSVHVRNIRKKEKGEPSFAGNRPSGHGTAEWRVRRSTRKDRIRAWRHRRIDQPCRPTHRGLALLRRKRHAEHRRPE